MNGEKNDQTIYPFEAFIIILCSIFFSWIPQLFIISFFPEPSEEVINPLGLKLSLLIGEAGLGLLPLLYLRMRNISIIKVIRFNKTPSIILGLLIPFSLAITVLVDEIDRLFQLIIPIPEDLVLRMNEVIEITSATDFLIIMLGAVLLAAVVEESIFRGILQGAIEKHIDVTQAVVYSSLLWAVIHLNPYQGVQIFLFGFVLGYLTWRTGSIVPGIICHAVNNSIAVLYANYNFAEKLPIYLWGDHVSPVLVFPALLVVVQGIRFIDRYYKAADQSSSTNISSD